MLRPWQRHNANPAVAIARVARNQPALTGRDDDAAPLRGARRCRRPRDAVARPAVRHSPEATCAALTRACRSAAAAIGAVARRDPVPGSLQAVKSQRVLEAIRRGEKVPRLGFYPFGSGGLVLALHRVAPADGVRLSGPAWRLQVQLCASPAMPRAALSLAQSRRSATGRSNQRPGHGEPPAAVLSRPQPRPLPRGRQGVRAADQNVRQPGTRRTPPRKNRSHLRISRSSISGARVVDLAARRGGRCDDEPLRGRVRYGHRLPNPATL